ncbi:methyltransferase type 11 [Embleya scabrispora]|uniref:Methyltransferase type 11 n=1 Tax=Embleya scabrispora TaxID=159449 RepID=A0A1T3P6H9_9ACTN|nr:class I SAM-dependent methyltransferase [Embleya scabrispora]OPC84674.1 methyltransferase type 11 [Embleya scabrispora]
MSRLEVSDLIVDHCPDSLERVPVARADVVATLRAARQFQGARIAARLPVLDGGVLDPAYVDRRLVAVHTELQRLSEELRIPERLAHLLRPLLAAVRSTRDAPDRIRVVDIGCGLGHVVRWLAAHDVLGPGVELVGADLHAALVAEATRLADDEGLPCRFVRANAFRLDTTATTAPEAAAARTATVYISTGLLHHLRGPDLHAFFAAQASPGTVAFCHYDIATTRIAPFGAWLFHHARMRDPLGRHDGAASARRAHDDTTLLHAAHAAHPLVPLIHEPTGASNPLCTTLRPVLGVRPDILAPLRAALGKDARRLRGAAG